MTYKCGLTDVLSAVYRTKNLSPKIDINLRPVLEINFDKDEIPLEHTSKDILSFLENEEFSPRYFDDDLAKDNIVYINVLPDIMYNVRFNPGTKSIEISDLSRNQEVLKKYHNTLTSYLQDH